MFCRAAWMPSFDLFLGMLVGFLIGMISLLGLRSEDLDELIWFCTVCSYSMKL